MAQMMALPNNESQTSKSEGEHLIMAAFDKPRMAVKENQDAMVTDFQNETYLDCMKSKNL